jgi:hypothetical protein
MLEDTMEMDKALKELSADLSDEEKRLLGFGDEAKNRRRAMEVLVEEVTLRDMASDEFQAIPARDGHRKDRIPSQGKEADSEVVFEFEDREDAQTIYDFMVENNLLIPGEISLRDIEGQASIALSLNTIVTKPEMIQVIMQTVEAYVSEDTAEEFLAFDDDMIELSEAALTEQGTEGAPKDVKGNPFHDRDTGKFTGRKALAAKKSGSWAMGKRKLKVTGLRKGKIHFGSTSHPCGRAARAKGKTTRCWDGKPGPWARVSATLGKKARKESLDDSDKLFLEAVSAIMRARASA